MIQKNIRNIKLGTGCRKALGDIVYFGITQGNWSMEFEDHTNSSKSLAQDLINSLLENQRGKLSKRTLVAANQIEDMLSDTKNFVETKAKNKDTAKHRKAKS